MEYSSDLYGYSAPEIVRLLGRDLREYRLRMEMTQEEMAAKAGVSTRTLANIERGNATNISLTNFLLLLKAVGRINAIKELFPELPVNLYQSSSSRSMIQRIKHKKK